VPHFSAVAKWEFSAILACGKWRGDNNGYLDIGLALDVKNWVHSVADKVSING